MKNQVKKITAGIIAVILILSCLTACGGNAENEEQSYEDTESILGIFGTSSEATPLETPIEDFEYGYDGDTQGVEIKKYIGTKMKVRIPDKIEGEPVTRIGFEAFRNSGVMSVYLPNTIKVIDEYAFRNCYGLININIPDSVTEIDGSAFSGSSLSDETMQKIFAIKPNA